MISQLFFSYFLFNEEIISFDKVVEGILKMLLKSKLQIKKNNFYSIKQIINNYSYRLDNKTVYNVNYMISYYSFNNYSE